MNDLRFLAPFLPPGLMLAGLANGWFWCSGIVFVVFGVVACIDMLFPGKRAGTSSVRDEPAQPGMMISIALRVWLPIHALIIGYGIHVVTTRELTPWQFFNVAASIGMIGGLLSGPVAHELMHQHRRIDRALAELLMATMTYSHFCVAHVRGHHVWVGTPQDSATARPGESVYAFYVRAIGVGWMSAWRLEVARQTRPGRRLSAWRNQVARGMICSLALYLGVAWIAGSGGVLLFALQGVVAILVLETLNYVQHYGLVRRLDEGGRFERVGPGHAWNTEPPVGNWFLLNLGHHSDHHCGTRQLLSQAPGSEIAPTFPTGLFGMGMLALLPALWFRVVDPLVAHYAWTSHAKSSGPNAVRTGVNT
ncbi:alkane 1-monooxygenase [Paraburkholderia sp. SIMBA_049]